MTECDPKRFFHISTEEFERQLESYKAQAASPYQRTTEWSFTDAALKSGSSYVAQNPSSFEQVTKSQYSMKGKL